MISRASRRGCKVDIEKKNSHTANLEFLLLLCWNLCWSLVWSEMTWLTMSLVSSEALMSARARAGHQVGMLASAQLSQDVLVDCWSDRIREAPDGSLEVSFGGTTSKPRTISFTSLNVNGCNHLTDRGEEKLQFLVRDIIREEMDVVLLQHTSAQKDDQPETAVMSREGMRMFVHGAEQENNHIHGVVGIILSRGAVRAWKEAGSPDPITSGIFSGTARYMSLDLNWKDSRGRTLQYRVISLYMPTSSYPAEEYTAVLDSLEKEVLSGCKRDGRIPIIGADINGSMGVYKKEEEESEGSDMLRSISPIGPYGIDKTNRNGQLFLSFLADNKLCSALMWSKGDFSTWRHPRYGEYHLDHLCVPRKMLNRVTKQGRYAYTETDHLGVTMDF